MKPYWNFLEPRLILDGHFRFFLEKNYISEKSFQFPKYLMSLAKAIQTFHIIGNYFKMDHISKRKIQAVKMSKLLPKFQKYTILPTHTKTNRKPYNLLTTNTPLKPPLPLPYHQYIESNTMLCLTRLPAKQMYSQAGYPLGAFICPREPLVLTPISFGVVSEGPGIASRQCSPE